MPIKRPNLRVRDCIVAFALCLAAAPHQAIAQSGPPNAPAPEAETDDNRKAVVLNPFVVSATEDSGYAATSTLAGTRIRTELKDVGSAVSVVTSKFLQDTGATSSQTLLQYTAGTEVGGAYGNFVGAGNGTTVNTDNARRSPQTNTRVRGLAAADNTRNFFLTDIPWDSYNTGRVDLQRGPNSILFGLGSPAGIINSSLNDASFKDENTLEFRYGSYGSNRVSLDLNKVLLKDELAIRVSGLNDKTYYQQDPAYNRDRRGYFAFRYDPKLLNNEIMRTSIKFNYENGGVRADRPRTTPPIDAITPWFTALNKQTYSAQTIGSVDPVLIASDKTAGALQTSYTDANGNNVTNPNYNPWLGNGFGGRLYGGPGIVFADPTSGANSGYLVGQLSYYPAIPGVSAPYYVYGAIQAYSKYAVQAKLPNYQLGVYKNKTISDSKIFDFYNKLMDGPNQLETQGWEAFNGTVSQTYFNNRLGFELAYDHQRYKETGQNYLDGNTTYLTVDIMSTLPDGRPNPNVGRPVVVNDSQNNNETDTKRDSFRATAFGEFNFSDYLDKSNWLTSFLGRHVFTGLYSTQKTDQFSGSYVRYTTDDIYGQLIGTSSFKDSNRVISTINYLGANLSGASLGQKLGISNIQVVQNPGAIGAIPNFNATLKPGIANTPANLANPANFIGWSNVNTNILSADLGNLNSLWSNANKTKDKVDSQALVWQGFFFDGTIVPTVGWRKDTAKSYNAGDVPLRTDSSAVVTDPTWNLPSGASDSRIGKHNVTFNELTGHSTSWSVVVHTPKSIKAKLPLETDFSVFYNRSDNFQPAANRADVLGNPIPAPTGKTKDYGFMISTLHDRLTLKVNWYETSVTNATLSGGLPNNTYMVGFGEGWGLQFAKWAQSGKFAFSTNFNQDANGKPIDPSVGVLAYQPGPGQSIKDAYAAEQAAINAFLASPPPQQFYDTWKINNQTWDANSGNWININQPGNLVVNGDTLSKGIEFEVTANPLKGWDITMNASKTHATQLNIAQSFATWVESRYKFYQGPAGDVRFWGGYYGGETLRSKFTNEFWSSYTLFRLNEGANVPELR
ncbi:MAG TPA: TonB-dependent receptor plug domain-containing protein, partial [Opitutaceae bacterium]|nr:TonB-dependent receptor plug domain-containing protein [Opitutaceae bacterium]